jgi:cation diffusion facilitator family transporter
MTGPAGHDHAHGHEHQHGHQDPHGHDHPRGGGGLLGRVVHVHSHDPAERVDAALEGSRAGVRAVAVSLGGLAATAALQATVVVLSGSVAVLADTVHNLADALTALPLWVAFTIGRRPANRRYGYGYGRAEDLAGVVVVAMIAASSVLAGYEAVSRLSNPRPIHHLWLVAVAGVIGCVGNELVAVYRIRVGRRIGSVALVADGLHARTDGLASLAVVVGAIGVAAGFPLADPVVGLIITVAILFVLRTAVRDVYRRLMDAVDPELVDAAEHALAGVRGVQRCDELRLRWIGHTVRAEASVVVDCGLSLITAHAIAEDARHELLHAVPKLTDAIIHVNPCEHGDRSHHDATAHHFSSAG